MAFLNIAEWKEYRGKQQSRAGTTKSIPEAAITLTTTQCLPNLLNHRPMLTCPASSCNVQQTSHRKHLARLFSAEREGCVKRVACSFHFIPDITINAITFYCALRGPEI
ncbi:hypothetical protein DINM_006329 [Dirofilaria immitis]|nr:hypothetical protein [Dirofilaria immitis]